MYRVSTDDDTIEFFYEFFFSQSCIKHFSECARVARFFIICLKKGEGMYCIKML